MARFHFVTRLVIMRSMNTVDSGNWTFSFSNSCRARSVLKGKGPVPGIHRVHGSHDDQSGDEMKTRHLRLGLCALTLTVMLAGCATKPYDYTNFRAHPPRSILVLPPLNESTAVEGTYGYLSTVTLPLAEMGYYVYPVVVVDQFMKENGMPTSGEMHQAPLDKIRDIR